MKHEEKDDEFVKQRVQSAADMIVMLLTEGQNYKTFFTALGSSHTKYNMCEPVHVQYCRTDMDHHCQSTVRTFCI